MKVNDYITEESLINSVAEGWVDQKLHPTLPLAIYTYSRKTVYEDHWTDATLKCRGLIVDLNTGEIVARPFEKFFNISTDFRPETWISNLPATASVVAEKLDGSLGILYQYKGFTGVASKGSFESDHALWATGWYNENCKNAEWPAGYTPVFEMICQSVQYHVVHYSLADQLVLIGLINNETGEELFESALQYWGDKNKIATATHYFKSVGQVLQEDRPNTEGYVLSWYRQGQTPLKVKVKHETFLELQKIAHAATPKYIFEALKEERLDDLFKWQNTVNEELNHRVRDLVSKLQGRYGEILTSSMSALYHARMRYVSRKDIAEYLINAEGVEESVVFAMLDSKDHKQVIWRIIEKEIKDEKLTPVFDTEDEE